MPEVYGNRFAENVRHENITPEISKNTPASTIATTEPKVDTAASEKIPQYARHPEDDTRVSNDPIEELVRRAQENLLRIGFVNVSDIIESFADKDRSGRHTTCIEIREEYWDSATKQVNRSISRVTTIAPEIRILKSGDYTTVVFHFEHHHTDMSLIWNVLERFGEESRKVTVHSEEIPVLVISGVPMALGGQYGMVATDPRFWCMQPSIPTSERCDQIRVLFPPEAVLFLKDATINTEEIRKHVKSELAAEQLQKEDRMRKDLEAEEFKNERDSRISNYLESERRNRHTFRATQKRVSDSADTDNEDDSSQIDR